MPEVQLAQLLGTISSGSVPPRQLAKDLATLGSSVDSEFASLEHTMSRAELDETTELGNHQKGYQSLLWDARKISTSCESVINDYLEVLRAFISGDGPIDDVNESYNMSIKLKRHENPPKLLQSFALLQENLTKFSTGFVVDNDAIAKAKARRTEVEDLIAETEKDVEKKRKEIHDLQTHPPKKGGLFGGLFGGGGHAEDKKKPKSRETLVKELAELQETLDQQKGELKALHAKIDKAEVSGTVIHSLESINGNIKKFTDKLVVFQTFYDLFTQDHRTLITLSASKNNEAKEFAKSYAQALETIVIFANAFPRS